MLTEAGLQPEDGWVLANAARLLEKHPDPELWWQAPAGEA